VKKLHFLIDRAKGSAFYLWLLNFSAARIVPFNRPHSFRIRTISKSSVTIELPYRKANLNHIKGIHACALATLCEYSTGIVLLASLDASSYRIILKNIHMTYHYQAKKNVYANFVLSDEQLTTIKSSLQTQEAIFSEHKVDVYDSENNHICTGLINWQIKNWKKVKMKV
jgi:acyl-coenzyme A thioesterase PaaI-like protein